MLEEWMAFKDENLERPVAPLWAQTHHGLKRFPTKPGPSLDFVPPVGSVSK